MRGTTAGGEGATPLATVTGTSYQDTTVVPGTTYYYVVKAVNAAGAGPAGHEVDQLAGWVMATGHAFASTPDGGGYWIASGTGSVTPHGDATGFGSPKQSGLVLNAPIVGMASTPDGQGYWLVASDGGVFPVGDATVDGSGFGTSGGPVVGIVPG